ncbi:MAG: 3-alpha,7-alpha,12-alpha-trihydroxy-5-beta-cholest-24-enoyl-CoA hydratase [SAR86 cluster bacterium]|uniref:3-alpha,7-alpha, 12-alpha-trihydroxy-5-beta-cholest-24-enoyl-CoA hydratase n=1 Tax=SAR86 cluster bacterium TaxID=2030880 RepID=A0A2A4MUF6_9GAMM|nr:MAG: 3-alpha,7-alpha,12-alpha-trihydroxy-5-beta-cholest-24-enoyl-CoA hydratase [SAR86 cluster bacterium]
MDYEKLLNRDFGVLEHHYTEKDSMLYALGIGLGQDPLDEECLRFVYEQDLKVMPSQAVVLAYPGFWAKEADTGIDWVRVLHAGQELIMHKPLPSSGTVLARTRITDIIDKGPGKGAIIISERTINDKFSGEKYSTVVNTTLARGDGGFGGENLPGPTPAVLPDRAPDHICDLTTLPRQALIYRLSGDYNPLHADPAVAKSVGFERPILHGLATYGLACRAVLKTVCDYDASRLTGLDVRFSAPVFPGETTRFEIWQDGKEICFRATVTERDLVVLNNGAARLA